ncbi:MAG: phosphoglycerate kinase [Salinivirgaceae bacterium]|nr:phosphoglycerate kinase [Salinivirgaceae bacterium]MDD4746116.1 phosphoglycerate kinase [Salinivirgaceae bacterium]MDY0279852.1 phosphoglycerate kinase [Salinivirgaceae bacterium]
MFAIDSYSFKEKHALIRVDFNVPFNAHGEITDDTRIKAALPTIKKILNDGGSVTLMSHLGRPDGTPNAKYSLKPIAQHLEVLLNLKVKFVDDCIGTKALEAKTSLNFGEVLLLENLRFYKEEENGELMFARDLASGMDVYINDAFGTAHRAHASTSIIAELFPQSKFFGYLMENELKAMDRVLHQSQSPSVAIIGGAKVSSKIEIIENLLSSVETIIIGGGMAFTFIKAKGITVGKSLVENDHIETALKIMKVATDKGVELLLPVDSVNASEFSNDAQINTTPIDKIPDNMMGLDIGPKTIELFDTIIRSSKTILWNGPMGVFEMSNFSKGTLEIAQSIAKATASGSFSLVGGGDSVAAINKFNLSSKISYVSTGGGAMLEYMEGKELPGVTAIRK